LIDQPKVVMKNARYVEIEVDTLERNLQPSVFSNYADSFTILVRKVGRISVEISKEIKYKTLFYSRAKVMAPGKCIKPFLSEESKSYKLLEGWKKTRLTS